MIKNRSITVKLLLLVVPMAVVMIAATIFLSIMVKDTESSTADFFMDEIAAVESEMISADRDMYQAQLASTICRYSAMDPTIPSSVLTDSVNDYSENVQQVNDRITKMRSLISADNTLYNTYRGGGATQSAKELLDAFASSVNDWTSSYNPATASGSFDHAYSSFEEARSKIDSLEDMVSAYSEEMEKEKAASTQRQIIITLVIVLAVGALMIAFAIYIISYIRKSLRSVQEDITNISNNDLEI